MMRRDSVRAASGSVLSGMKSKESMERMRERCLGSAWAKVEGRK